MRDAIDGETRFDVFTRKIYSTDASMYAIEPVGVVLPKTDADVRKTLEIARRHRAAILPRGGGTSLAGQTVGEALVLDFSKYMNQALELNADEGCARPAGTGAGSFQRLSGSAWLRFRPQYVHEQPRHHRRHGGEQFFRVALHRLREDGGSRHRSLRLFRRRRAFLFRASGCGVSRRTHARGFADRPAAQGAEGHRGRAARGD